MSKPEPETLGVPQEFNVLDTAINRERANAVSGLTRRGNASFNEIKARRNCRVSGIQGKGQRSRELRKATTRARNSCGLGGPSTTIEGT